MSFDRQTLERQVKVIADDTKDKITGLLLECVDLERELNRLEVDCSKPIAALDKQIDEPGISIPGVDLLGPAAAMLINAGATALLKVNLKPEAAAKKKELMDKLDPAIKTAIGKISILERKVRELELLDKSLSTFSSFYKQSNFGQAKKQLQELRKKAGDIITANNLKDYGNKPDTSHVFDYHYAHINDLFKRANKAIDRKSFDEANAYLKIALATQNSIMSVSEKLTDDDVAKAIQFKKKYDAAKQRIADIEATKSKQTLDLYNRFATDFLRLSKKDSIKRTVYNFFGKKTRSQKQAYFIENVLNSDMASFLFLSGDKAAKTAAKTAAQTVAQTVAQEIAQARLKADVETAVAKLYSKTQKSKKHKLFASALAIASKTANPDAEELFVEKLTPKATPSK